MTDSGRVSDGGRLRGHLRLPGATALAITIVVGSGALILPGIAYQQVGDAAVFAWLCAVVITIPLLIVFARLGAEHPGAGGVAGFAQAAFGRRMAAGIEVLTMGTFGLGIPAIALTGAGYLTALPGLADVPHEVVAAILIIVAASVVSAGVRLSTPVQIVLAVILTVGLIAIGVAALVHSPTDRSLPEATPAVVIAGAQAIGIVFFAFTGWEMLSFTTEEYVDPRRDFPRVVVISFVVVSAMYLLLAVAVHATLPRDAPTTSSAPVRAVVDLTVSPVAGSVVSILGAVIIVANLVGAMWGASRLVMSSAREGLLPVRLAMLRGNDPVAAVVACSCVFLAVIGVVALGWTSIGNLLVIAGQNFYLLYLVCTLAYSRLFRGWRRVAGIALSLILSVIAAMSFGAGQLAYAIVLLAVGGVLVRGGHLVRPR